MDLADADAIESGIAAAIEEFGGLDVLVTNHGGPNNASFEDTSLEAFDGGYNDVLRSTVVQCKAALPALRDGGGAITHLVAASAAEPTAHGTLGNVFRPGIYGLSKTLANEEGKNGVRSNCVAPRGALRPDRVEDRCTRRTRGTDGGGSARTPRRGTPAAGDGDNRGVREGGRVRLLTGCLVHHRIGVARRRRVELASAVNAE